MNREDKYDLKEEKVWVSSKSLGNLFHKETELGINENLNALV